MRRLRVYIDTSVVGGCFDSEFETDSLELFDRFISGQFTAVISDILLLELGEAPEDVRSKLDDIPQEYIEYVALSEESVELANQYIDEGAVAERSLSDARHIAIASVEHVNVLVSWNFRHIVNLNRIHLYHAVNLRMGYPMIEIRSPGEVVYD